jgi:hypothetical protein
VLKNSGTAIIANIGAWREIGFIREALTDSGIDEMISCRGVIREIELF